MKPTPVNAVRHQSPYSFRAKAGRMLWSVTEVTLFRMTWPTWYRYRAFLLRCFGAEVSPGSRIRRTCRFMCPWNLRVGADTATGENVFFYCLGQVRIGERVTLSHDAVLCAGTHDHRTIEMPLLREPVTIEDDAWVAFGGFVGPGVTIGQGAIVAARGVAVRDLEAWGIFGGNPAKRIGDRPPLTAQSQTASEPAAVSQTDPA